MKKSVVLVIVLIYIVSIVLVGFIGLKMKVYEENIYVERIVCKNDEFVLDENSNISGKIFKTYTEGLRVNIICEVIPENATNQKLDYQCEQSGDYNIIKESDGSITIEFIKATTVDITFVTTDGSNKKLKVKVIAFTKDF